MANKRVYGRPKDDSYAAFKEFLASFVQALKPGATVEPDEESTRRAYEKYLAAKRKSGASK